MEDAEETDYDRAATGYLVWPLSLFALAREPAGTSTWMRIHTRQAVMFGLVASLGFLVVMALPLLVVIAVPAISTGATVTLYATGLVVDVVAFIALVAVAFAFAARASRGQLFAIPVVSELADRIFRLER